MEDDTALILDGAVKSWDAKINSALRNWLIAAMSLLLKERCEEYPISPAASSGIHPHGKGLPDLF